MSQISGAFPAMPITRDGGPSITKQVHGRRKNEAHIAKFSKALQKRLYLPSPSTYAYALISALQDVLPSVTQQEMDAINDKVATQLLSYLPLRNVSDIVYEAMHDTKSVISTEKIQSMMWNRDDSEDETKTKKPKPRVRKLPAAKEAAPKVAPIQPDNTMSDSDE